MKITFFEVPKEEQSIFTNSLTGFEIALFEEKLKEETAHLAKDADIVSVFVGSMVSKNVIEQIPNLKFIATRSTGFDHVDRECCASKGILVSNVPAYGSRTVAEFAFALLLSLTRKIFGATRQLKETGEFSIFGFEGMDLNEKTIGVIGTGKIGKNVIRIEKGFNMNVLAYDLYPDINFAKELGFEYKSLPEVISQSDVITLHTPYTKDNHHLINKENISLMKKGVYLINTARGELIDTDALVWGLNEKIIGGLGIDVMEGERELKEQFEILSSLEKSEKVKDYKTLLEDRMIIDMPNVVVTPHIAFDSKEAEGEIIKTTIENIKGFISGTTQNLIK
jgi:D-lactate dehydrogenase